MTTARQTAGAALVREVREAPTTTVLGPLAFVGLGAWVMAATPAWWLGLVIALTGAGLFAFTLGSVLAAAAGYAGPSWWRAATGRDVDARRSPGA